MCRVLCLSTQGGVKYHKINVASHCVSHCALLTVMLPMFLITFIHASAQGPSWLQVMLLYMIVAQLHVRGVASMSNHM